MKILLVSPYYSPGVGGSSRLLQDIVDFLHRRGHEIQVLTYGAPPSETWREFDRQQPYPIHRIAWQRLPGMSSLLMLKRVILLTAGRRFDVIFVLQQPSSRYDAY